MRTINTRKEFEEYRYMHPEEGGRLAWGESVEGVELHPKVFDYLWFSPAQDAESLAEDLTELLTEYTKIQDVARQRYKDGIDPNTTKKEYEMLGFFFLQYYDLIAPLIDRQVKEYLAIVEEARRRDAPYFEK